jgi:hypothetical protein
MSVRWDAVISRNAASAAALAEPPPALPRAPSRSTADRIKAHVALFGALASASPERSIALELPITATVADVLAALRERLGEAFLARVLDPLGAKHRHCRLFVDGYPVEDLTMPIDAAAEPTQIEIILLIAPEGG